MDTVIDKLTFAVDADLAPYRAKMVEAEAQAQRTGRAVAASLGTPLKETASAAVSSTGAIKGALGEVERSTKSLHGSTATATREFRALFDELSSGRTRQTPGTLAIIATRVFGISGATLAWGAAIAAIPAAFAIAAVESERSLARIRTALALTGNASGITFAQAQIAAAQIAAGGRFSQLGAQGAVASLASGMVPGRFIPQAATAGANYALATGEKEEAVNKLLIDMFSDPAKTASELNRQMNLLTAEQTRQVEELQRSGEYERAAQIVLDTFTKRTTDAANSASAFSKILNAAEVAVGGFVGFLGHVVNAGAAAAVAGGLVPGVTPGKPTPAGDAAADALRRQAARAIGDAMADSDKGAGSFQHHLLELREELNRSQLAVRLAKQTHSSLTDALIKQRDVAATVLKNTLSPAQEAELRAKEQQRIDATAPSRRSAVSQAVEAERARRANLANPAMAPYADAIYRAQMSTAAGDHYSAEGNRQAKNLAAMQAEAAAARDLAHAFDISSAAAEEARIIGEAHTAFVKGEINDEKAYAAALRERAFWQSQASTAQSIETQRLGNIGLASIAGAGGNPAAIAAARREAEARQQTAGEFARAGTNPEFLAKANSDLEKLIDQLKVRDDQNIRIATAASLFGTTQQVGALSARSAAMAGGATPDDLRHLAVAQKAFDELITLGLDPSTQAFRDQYNAILPLNEKLSDLTDQIDKAAKAAQDYASGITGPLKQFLTQGGNPLDAAAQAGQNILGTLVQTQIIDPLQEKLTGLFGTLLGVPGGGKPDGSPLNPFYVVGSPVGGGSGGGGIGNAVSSIFGSIFGGGTSAASTGAGIGNAAATLGSSGGGDIFSTILSSVLSFFGGGLAGGGRTDPGKFYVVGENGPEIFGPGADGRIVPLSAPRIGGAVGAGSNAQQSTGGDTHNWNFGPNSNKQDVLLARGQIEAAVTRAAARGRRNT
jgi:hypothetical protein